MKTQFFFICLFGLKFPRSVLLLLGSDEQPLGLSFVGSVQFWGISRTTTRVQYQNQIGTSRDGLMIGLLF